MDSDGSLHCDIVEGEVQIMESAFGNDFEDLRVERGKSSSPPFVRIRLGPHHTQGGTLHSHIFIVIEICTSTNYPNEPASLSLVSYAGISERESEQLMTELNDICLKASENGMVIMLEISHYVQNFLSDHARPFTESIYAEMIAGWQVKEKALQLAHAETLKEKEKQEEERRIIMKEEFERIQEALKEEAKERKERMKIHTHNRGNIGCLPVKAQFLPRRSSSECNKDGTQDVFTSSLLFYSNKQEFAVHIIDRIGHRNDEMCTVFLGLEKITSRRCVVYNWFMHSKFSETQLKSERDYLFEDLVTKINSLETEMSFLLKLSHDNLVPYCGMNCLSENGVLNIQLLQDYIQGISMKCFLDLKIPLNESMLHHVLSGVLNALNYLHEQDIVHRNLRDSCIYLDHNTHSIKLSDFSIERKCIEALMEYSNKEIHMFYPTSPSGRGGKKGDIFRLGIVASSLYVGERISEVNPPLPSNAGKNFKNFLTHCLELSDSERWTSYQLLSHPFLKISSDDHRKKTHFVFPVDVNSREDLGDEGKGSLPFSLQMFDNIKSYSRFTAEYIILELLGKGGFGHVFKVRNRVDDGVYALKKIPLHNRTELSKRKMIREVKLLSSLNHENVVRYYTSWMESFTQDEVEENDILSAPKNFVGRASDEKNECCSFHSDDNEDAGFIESESDDDRDWLMQSLRFELEAGGDDESDNVLFLDTDSDERKNKNTSSNNYNVSKSTTNSCPSRRYQYLFIQMQYCEKNTLRQAIDHCLNLEEKRMWRLFREITNGLDYIHSQGLIHRDLKPGNIFLDSSDHVKIGDFGLATVAFKEISAANELGVEDVNVIYNDAKENNLTSQIGTTFYIAPELTKVTGKISYSNKVDIYSLGIIFFEMCYNFSTGMERVKILSALRLPQPIFPENFGKYLIKKKEDLIRWLLNHDPMERPCTEKLLKSSLLPPPTAEEQKFISTLQNKIQNTRSKEYQDILNLFFKPTARPELEATFEVCLHKTNNKQIIIYDFVMNQIMNIFKSHGGVWITTPFYIPKGSFYTDKDNLVSLMSKGGELITAQFELRYPFARFVARSDLRHLRRYGIDRVQRAYKISGVHPTEIYECAFDIIASKCELSESFARSALVVQDVFLNISSFQLSQLNLEIGHSEVVKIILIYCGIEESLHSKIFPILHDFRRCSLHLEYFGDCLRSVGISWNAVESLKGFLQMNGSVEEFCSFLLSKISNSKKKQFYASFLNSISEIKEIFHAFYSFGVKFDLSFRPLLVVDHNLYKGPYFQLLLSQHEKSKHSAYNILAQGGSYEHLISHQRNLSFSCTRRLENAISAVGVSLPLDRVVGSVDSSKNFTSSIYENKLRNYSTPFAFDVEVFICAIEERLLEQRIDLTNKFKVENIKADHGFVLSMSEAENLFEEKSSFIPHFLFLVSVDKVICRSTDAFQEKASRTTDRKMTLSDASDLLPKWIKSSRWFEPGSINVPSWKKEILKSTVSKSDDFNIHMEYITRKQTRIRETAKLDSTINEEVRSYLGSRFSNLPVTEVIDVLVMDLDRKVLLALGQIDVDSSVKNFNESVLDVKARFPEMREYLDRITKILSKKIFYGKKSSRPVIIIGYSILSECLKRIV